MSIGIDFILRANSAGFTRGLAQANNQLKGLKHSLREGDVGMGLKRMLGAGAVIEGMRSIINNAQETRKALEDMGKPMSDNIRSLAEYGDALDGIKSGLMSAGTSVLGFFTGIGDRLGNTINIWRNEFGGANLDLSDAAAKSGRAADEQEKATAKAAADKKARNSREALAKSAAELAAAYKKYDEEGIGLLEKRNILLAEQQALADKLGALYRVPNILKDDPALVTAARTALANKELEIQAVDKKRGTRHDKYLGTVEQLSNQTISEGMDPAQKARILQARTALQLEATADQRGFQGDFAGSDLAMGMAAQARQGLSGFVKTDEANKAKDFYEPIVEAIDRWSDKTTPVIIVKP